MKRLRPTTLLSAPVKRPTTPGAGQARCVHAVLIQPITRTAGALPGGLQYRDTALPTARGAIVRVF